MTKDSHPIREPLNNVIAINTNKTPEEITEAVLSFLGEAGAIQYAPKGSLKLLTPAGRVLVTLMERPDITMRQLSIYLGITEAGVMKYILMLIRSNVITRTKVKGRNQYRINLEEALKAPDIIRFHRALQKTIDTPPKNDGDITPSDDPDAA